MLLESKKPVILFAINDLAFGGGQRTVIAEANEFFKLGYKVKLLTLLPSDQRSGLRPLLFIPDTEIVQLSFKSFFDIREFLRLLGFLRKARPDVIFSNLFFTNTMIRLAKIFFWKQKIIVREGNIPVEKSFAMRIVDSILSLWTVKIIVNAEAIKDEFSRKLLISKRKMEVIYNGIGEEFFLAAAGHLPERQRSSVTLIIIGSLTAKKGHRYLIDALAEVKKKKPGLHWKLLVVGDGPLRPILEEQVDNLGLAKNIVFRESSRDVKELLLASDIFVLPSLWEGMPNAMLEAMALGLPVIATAVGGVTEVLLNAKNALVVRPQDMAGLAVALETLIQSSELRRVLGKTARASVEAWTWPNHVSALIRLIEKI